MMILGMRSPSRSVLDLGIDLVSVLDMGVEGQTGFRSYDDGQTYT